MKPKNIRDQKLITYWLFAGMLMVFVQILLGGITRLTGSGLSITRWDIVMGSIPPLNPGQWEEAFNLYKTTPQYQHINAGMLLSEFKYIFFWEFFHRLWARSMGFVFIIPFVFFLIRRSLSRTVLKNLFWVIVLAALAAIFGWIMVASGLIERPWVNAYKLTIHLSLGILLFETLFYTWLNHRSYQKKNLNRKWHKAVIALLFIAGIQVIFGGLMSGMKAALSFPTWPLISGQWIPSLILDTNHWNSNNFLLYDQSGFMPALVQFVHRNLAYVLFIVTSVFAVKWYLSNDHSWRWISFILLGIIVVQISLGILTLINSIGYIPVVYGSLHQGLGILFITALFYLHLVLKPENIK
ncbi:MAG: COX15/CtaA family protein [Saprospiraceae bacterium]|uniref:COX15/CtaA family protein n=1 Tax=Candidatus Opimibacter skivensis TaxID=2982028 RepID=A0A9D7SWC9_9BACT|nr:COX15/CtaA family protein [Candidatus Opimibacter skivensis]